MPRSQAPDTPSSLTCIRVLASEMAAADRRPDGLPPEVGHVSFVYRLYSSVSLVHRHYAPTVKALAAGCLQLCDSGNGIFASMRNSRPHCT